MPVWQIVIRQPALIFPTS